MSLATRLQAIEPFHVMDLLAKAKALQAAGEDIIHLEVGEPDFTTPLEIRQVGAQAILDGATFYTAAKGHQPLREKLSSWYQQHYGVSVAPERFIITPGASSALFIAMSMIIDSQDTLMLPLPGYPCNRHFVELLGGRAIEVPLDPNDNYHHDAKRFEHHWQPNTKGLLVASPQNPTGHVLSKTELAKAFELTQQKGQYLIVDEIYHGLVYDDANKNRATSILEITDQAFVVNSFSKYFNMTGWRLGWLIVPPGMEADADKLAQNLYLAATTSSQIAAIRALDNDMDDHFQANRAEFGRRRAFLVEALTNLGFKVLGTPKGAFYIYVDASPFTHNAMSFCQQVLQDCGIAITPGLDFDPQFGKQCIRFAYTCSIERLEEAMSRLKAWMLKNSTN